MMLHGLMTFNFSGWRLSIRVPHGLWSHSNDIQEVYMSGRQRGRQVSAPKTQTITISDDGIEVRIKGEPKKPFGRDLFTRGITTLITAADTYSWEKSYFEGRHEKSPTE